MLFYLHIHQDFDARLDVVDQREPVELFELLLLIFEEFLVVVVDFLVRADLDRKIQLKDGLLERLVCELERLLLLEQLVVSEEIEVSIAVFAVVLDIGGESLERAESVGDPTNDSVARPVCVVDKVAPG